MKVSHRPLHKRSHTFAGIIAIAAALVASATAGHSAWQLAFDSASDLESVAANDQIQWRVASPKHKEKQADSHHATHATEKKSAEASQDGHGTETASHHVSADNGADGHASASHNANHDAGHEADHHSEHAKAGASVHFPGGHLYFYILFVLALMALGGSIALKSALLSTLAFAIGSITLAQLAVSGVGGQMLWSPAGRFAGSSSSLFLSLASVWFVAFAKQYYAEQVQPLSKEEGFFNFLLGLNLFLFVAFALSPNAMAYQGALGLGAFNTVMLLGLSGKLAMNGVRAAYPFTFGAIALSCFHALYFAEILGPAGLILASVLSLIGWIAGSVPIQMALTHNPAVDLKSVQAHTIDQDEPEAQASNEADVTASGTSSLEAPIDIPGFDDPTPDPIPNPTLGPVPDPSSATAPNSEGTLPPRPNSGETSSTSTEGWIAQVSGLFDQIVFKIDRSLHVEALESPLVEWWLGVEDLHFDWLNENWSKQVSEPNALKESLKTIFDDPRTLELELAAFPETIEFNGRTLKCQYQAVVNGEQVVAIACSLTNVSELSEVQEDLTLSKDLNRMLVRAVLQREDFAQFVNQSLGKFGQIIKHLKSAGPEPDFNRITETFQSVQSGAEIYSMSKVVGELQQLIDLLDMIQSGPAGMDAQSQAQMFKHIMSVWNQFKSDVQRLHDTLGFDLTESPSAAA